ncbi:hypothetical protein EDB85DRAFT_1891786 [Lactarius pseudohatsudake]|nr:hypothetical protein EDB85DRAFT_1891786 [Lactarius pseudohatsudake]
MPSSPTDALMTADPPGWSEVDLIYDLLVDLPTVNDDGYSLTISQFRQALVLALSEPLPALGNTSPLTTLGLYPMRSLHHSPPSAFTEELEALWDSLNLCLDALHGAIEGIRASPLPSAPVPAPPTQPPASKPCAQKPRALAPIPTPASHPPPPTFASLAKTPAWPSLVVSLRLLEVVGHLNTVLASEEHLVTLSAAWWTAKNNLVVTAGPDTLAHHLTATSHLISDSLATFLSADQSPLPVQARENCKWARLLVNGIPTRASNTCVPYSPSELHAALLADNPAYRGLRLTLPPSWVRAPTSYTPGSISSLVLTFEDPSGSSLCSLLAEWDPLCLRALQGVEVLEGQATPHWQGRTSCFSPP